MNFIRKITHRPFCQLKNLTNCKILGIETSCDDTGSAVVDDNRCILGESLKSHQKFMLQIGGIFPMVVQDLHSQCIEETVNQSLANANLTVSDVDAIAVTVQPGLALSLLVGVNYAKMLSKKFQKPLIPIHHMEAHALTSRLVDESINYPFLALLISGGHCILTLVLSVDKFIVLGKCLDNGPGEAYDKVARKLKLRNLAEYRDCSSGAAVENMAKKGNPLAFEYAPPLRNYKDCNFSFCGIKEAAFRQIHKEEKAHEIEGDRVLPNANDLCASFQFAILKHLCWRLQRAMEYIEINSLLSDSDKVLVMSGGVACNSFIQKGISIICKEKGYRLSVPPLKFCTDNGVMIAWNGLERYQNNIGIYSPNCLEQVDICPKAPLGEDITRQVWIQEISCKWIKINEMMSLN